MSLEEYFNTPAYRAEKKTDLNIIQTVIERFADEKPLKGVDVVMGHLIVRNSLTMVEALWRGGANVTLCGSHLTASQKELCDELAGCGFPVLPMEEGVQRGDFYLDVSGELGRRRTPRAAVEVTRTGEHYYINIPCPVISIDNSRIKLLEDFFGTGESFMRAWQKLRPDDPLNGKNLVQFGYGKVGRGLAYHAGRAGMQVTVVDIDAKARQLAEAKGVKPLDPQDRAALQKVLAGADVVVGVTGIPGSVGRAVPPEWLRANHPVLSNIGMSEFGPAIAASELLGGQDVPANFHLERPTRNRYMDPTFCAQVLALEELVHHPQKYPEGIHPLPDEIDLVLLDAWRSLWPAENLAALEEQIGLLEQYRAAAKETT